MDAGSRLARVRPLQWGLPLLMALAMTLLQSLLPAWADRIEGPTVDARFRLRGPESPVHPITIIALDETSFQSFGDLQGENIRTWPRARWASLVDLLASGQPRVIALDVVFDTPGWDAGGDQALAEAIARAGNVVLAAHIDQAGHGYTLTTFSPPLKSLRAAAAAVGVANLAPDADGVVRQATLIWPWETTLQSSFALAIATLARQERVTIPAADLGGTLSLPVRFRGPEGTFETISLIDLWEGVIPVDSLRDRIVLVGYTTRLEQDRHRAPFAPQTMPGVEIQATMVDSLLAGDWMTRPPAWLAALLVGLAGLLAAALVNLPRPGPGLLAFALLLLLYSATTCGLFIFQSIQLPLATPILSALLSGGAAVAERAVFAEADKRRMRQRFAGVMSAERLRTVMDHWEDLRRPERPCKQAAILFADIRGFTSASETLLRENRSPEMVRFLNAYLEVMSDAVFREGGVIYDVVGDGLMVLFGLPDPLPDFAERAARAAVRMALAARNLQPLWPLRDMRPLQMGIGLHCGEVVDALVGGSRRMNYQVIGDPVNTAARVEAYCKEVMVLPRPPGGEIPPEVTVLLTTDLYTRVREHVLADESIPPFEARGKARPLHVVRLLGWKGGLT